MADRKDMLRVGVITTTHGVRGEVKVFPTTDDPKRFKQLKEVYLDTGKELRLLEITQVKFFKQLVILKFRGLDNVNDVEHFRKLSLLIQREDAVPLEEDEYFVADLIDMEVILEDDTPFGILKDVMETGANDVYVIDTRQHGEVLIPAIKECILEVDPEENRMKIRLLNGLL